MLKLGILMIICLLYGTNGEIAKPSSPGNCNKPYFDIGDGDCFFMTSNQDWSYAKAKYHCNNWHGQVFTLASDEKLAYVKKSFQKLWAGSRVMMSAVRTKSNGVKVWDVNDKPLGIDYFKGESRLGLQCVALNVNNVTTGPYWFEIPCDVPHALFFCELVFWPTPAQPHPPKVAAPTPTEEEEDYDDDYDEEEGDANGGPCKGKFVDFDGHCLYANVVWHHYDVAERLCNEMGAKMVSIQNAKKQETIHRFITQVQNDMGNKQKHNRWWLSTIKNVDGTYTWTDSGAPVVYWNWGHKKKTLKPGKSTQLTISLNGPWIPLPGFQGAGRILCEHDVVL